jgi:hypothetical protein
MGGLKHHKIEGGQGGRRGHSNMEHWVTTAEIKGAARGLRRREAKTITAQERATVDEAPSRSADSRPGLARSDAELDHLASALPEERVGRTRRVHPYQWLWEPLETDPTFVLRPMFGGRAAYIDGRLTLYFTAGEEPWRGVLACTDRVHHASLLAEFPDLTPHPILPKWLYLPETAGAFEPVAERLVALARRHDPRLGVDPQPKKRARRGRRARR